MMTDTTYLAQLLSTVRPELARPRIEAFGKQFGLAHLYFAQHAAFPLSLTPDLLYRLWANFQQDTKGIRLNIPWIAVADLLLSDFCKEVGYELYEMDLAVRNALLHDLEINFGDQRIKELSKFLLMYIQQQLDSPDPYTRDSVKVQKWIALAYFHPNIVARDLASALRVSLEENSRSKQVRLASLIETLADPLADFMPLLSYARGVGYLVLGDVETAITQFNNMGSRELQGIPLQIPESIRSQVQVCPNCYSVMLASAKFCPKCGTHLGVSTSCVLIASLGGSPTVITAIVDLLDEQAKEGEVGRIDKVVVLCPQGEVTQWSYELVVDGLRERCQVESWPLLFEDANGEEESFEFLRVLYQLLTQHQALGDVVYLSLAGGRKNMSALMALMAPLFSCVKKLYHMIDLDEDTRKSNFVSIEEMIEKFSEAERREFLHPNTSSLHLIDIPYGEKQQVRAEFRSRLFTITNEELNNLWEKSTTEAETTELYRALSEHSSHEEWQSRPNLVGKFLRVFITEHVKNEYERIQREDALRARKFAECFEQMHSADRLARADSQHGYIPGKIFPDRTMLFHFYKRERTLERVFYYTLPEGIHRYPHADVREVVICGLVGVREPGGYEPSTEVLLELAARPLRKYPLETLFPTKSILLVPLGTSSMAATQLYTLLTEEGHLIQEVRLIYPERSNRIRRGVRLLKQAFSEKGVICLDVPVKGLRDIASSKDCQVYQDAVEQVIQDVQTKYPDWQIDLALSGGDKSMAALTMFAAQRKHIRYVYHTLINDEELYRRVAAETDIETLDSPKLSRSMVNDRLFLRAYDITKFALFRVPVLPAGV